ncbi:MAG: hypothetical protein C7B44_15340 [Sulfobacillus thermosulfidooxidans]|nr:MAG: hypothetical protein C7B44_15340 [Sulfobacillus thermosulfidooxidans]
MSDQSQKPEGPQGTSGPDEKVSVSWLILQRLDDLKDQIASVRHDLDQFKEDTVHRFENMQRLWLWTIGLIAVMALGLLAKLLVPGT